MNSTFTFAALVMLEIVCWTSNAACEQLTFTDITSQAGTGGPTGSKTGGHGVMFADVDEDGRPDLYFTMIFRQPMADLFFRNVDGREFADEGEHRGIADFDGGSHGACFADLDNDGDYDLFNGTTWDHDDYPSRNNIFRNDGAGRFANVTVASGIPKQRCWPTRGVLTFDMDRDGDLDLFCVTNYLGSKDAVGERNEVYRNDGRLKFTPVEAGELFTAPCGQGAIDTDYDGDGDIDVIAANRTGPVNILRNDGKGNFELVNPKSIGLGHQAGDGISLADVDNDGDLDMLLASDDVGHLYLNDGRGTFAFRQSFSQTDGYMGGFADLDNDGDVDLTFAGDDVCWLNDGTGHFVKGPRVPVSGIADPRGIAFANIDGDGDLDFAIGCKRSRNWLVRNNLDSGKWLKVELVSPQGQAGAFGAKVKVYPAGRRDMLLGLREARSNNGYLGQNDPVLHFGLGTHESLDVSATFLDGTVVTRTGVPANETITIDGRSPSRAETDDRGDGAKRSRSRETSGPQTLRSKATNNLDRTGTQWAPFIEWSLKNETYEGNPFDLIASATFVHKASGEKHTTGMFFASEDNWRFRFTGTRTGVWTFTTSSSDTDLNGISGTVTIRLNPNRKLLGFVTHSGNKWARQVDGQGTRKAFVPQFVMYAGPRHFHNKPEKIDADIKTFLHEHGFNGFHVMGSCHWLDINQLRSDRVADTNPDPRTFEALELLITKVHAAGGTVHIWMWGDESRRWTPRRWGLNGEVDKRLQRYLAARLGPLPGWTMGYGFDLFEWVREDDLHRWHDHMHEQLGWPHMLGGRAYKNSLRQIYEGLDYSAYEQHRPDYTKYVETIRKRTAKPSFSEDRFRIRDSKGYAGKDYTMEMTRRALWHSTMAGGVANIWGHLPRGRDSWLGSAPYGHPEWIKTYSTFFANRFSNEMESADHASAAYLGHSDQSHFIFYQEDTKSIELDLSKMKGTQRAIAVDALKPYAEIDLGKFKPTKQTWTAPYKSDWAIAVGSFHESAN